MGIGERGGAEKESGEGGQKDFLPPLGHSW